MCLKHGTRSACELVGSSQARRQDTSLCDSDRLLLRISIVHGYFITLQVYEHIVSLHYRHYRYLYQFVFNDIILQFVYSLTVSSMSDTQAVSTTTSPSAPKRPRLVRPPPLKVAEVNQNGGREVTYNQKTVHVAGRRQPSLNISVTGSPPLTTDTAVQATVSDFDVQINCSEIDNANEMLNINRNRFNKWVPEVIEGVYVITSTSQRNLPSPIHPPDASPNPITSLPGIDRPSINLYT